MVKVNKSIILAAGKSSQFFPPLYDKPKGLFEYKGEVLIERQIRQLREAGVEDIAVVVGYEKEHFFYLEDRFGVDLVVSTRWADESNLSSLDLVRDRLGGSFLCCADHWYAENPFVGFGGGCRSVRMAREQGDATRARRGRLRRRAAGEPPLRSPLGHLHGGRGLYRARVGGAVLRAL